MKKFLRKDKNYLSVYEELCIRNQFYFLVNNSWGIYNFSFFLRKRVLCLKPMHLISSSFESLFIYSHTRYLKTLRLGM